MIRAHRPIGRAFRFARAPGGAASARAGAYPPLRWRRVVAAARAQAMPARLAYWTLELRQHLHLHFGPLPAGAQARPGASPPMAWPDRTAAGARPGALPRPAWRAGAPRMRIPSSAAAAWPAATAPLRARAAGFGMGELAPRPRAERAGPAAIATRAGARPMASGPAAASRQARLAIATPSPAAQVSPLAPVPLVRAARIGRPTPAATGGAQRKSSAASAATQGARRTPQAPAMGAQPAVLEWRRQAGASAGEATHWPAGPAAGMAQRAFAGASAPPPMQAPQAALGAVLPGAAGFDPAAADRLADDVLKRVERRLRIERERRGL